LYLSTVTQSLKKKNRVADRKKENRIPVRHRKKKKTFLSDCQAISGVSLPTDADDADSNFLLILSFFFTINRFQKDYSGPSTKNV
jgi:hypothetical protein